MILSFLGELFSELFFCSMFSASSSSKAPRWFRVLALTVMYPLAIFLSVAIAIKAFTSGSVIGVVVIGVIGLVLTLCWILGLRNIFKTRRIKCQQR